MPPKMPKEKFTKTKKYWQFFTGKPEEFSMENRAFNFVCVVSFFLLFVCLIFEIILTPSITLYVVISLMFLLGILYYQSRVKYRFKISIILYAIGSYLGLIINYFENSGSYGPTLLLSFVTFTFMQSLARPGKYYVWVIMHIVLTTSLLAIEYIHPHLVPYTHLSLGNRLLDIASMNVVSTIFLFLVHNYLRNYYETKREQADERALAIADQNELIKKQNQELERLNAEKNKLFSILAHDIRSPLDQIKGFLELHNNNLLTDEERQELTDALIEQTKYTADLLFNLTTWSKSQMEGMKPRTTAVKIDDFINAILINKQAIAERKKITIRTSAMEQLNVLCDTDMLRIVLRNLINNAIKFTNEAGAISITVHKDGENAIIAIRDNGIGIENDDINQLFTFKTRSSFGTNNEKGIGLGLLVCRDLMEQQNGHIWANSRRGIGSTFFISLPIANS